MISFVIPTVPEPDQQFTIDLDNETVDITLRWNETAKFWVMDMKGLTFNLDIKGIALGPGVDILSPFAIRELGRLWIIDTDNLNYNPDFDNFGNRYQLLYVGKQ